MTVGELKKLLEDRKTPDDHMLRIRYRGGIGSAMPVKSAGPGIDWNRNSIVLQPETEMTIDEWYRSLKKVADADAAHIGHVLKEAEKVVESYEIPFDPAKVYAAIEQLKVSLERLAKFQKQGF